MFSIDILRLASEPTLSKPDHAIAYSQSENPLKSLLPVAWNYLQA